MEDLIKEIVSTIMKYEDLAFFKMKNEMINSIDFGNPSKEPFRGSINFVDSKKGNCWNVFFCTKEGYLRPYEKDYDLFKDYKGKIYVDILGARHIKPVIGTNYIFKNNVYITTEIIN